MSVDVDDGSLCDAGGNRQIREVIDSLDGSKRFGDQRDAVQVNIIGMSGREYARSVVVC
jgi:hypothetical protein